LYFLGIFRGENLTFPEKGVLGKLNQNLTGTKKNGTHGGTIQPVVAVRTDSSERGCRQRNQTYTWTNKLYPSRNNQDLPVL
jgi:hypothetical protein